MPKIGVLALQGAFREHAEALTALGADVALVKRPEHLAGIDAIFLPGGESTTIDKLLDSSGLRTPLTQQLRDGLPAFATCAGLIVCATDIVDGRPDQLPIGVLDVTVRRNGYGRQNESFEAPLDVRDLPGGAFPGVFIRAPLVERTGSTVEVLAEHEGVPVLGRQGVVWFASFHPELANDLRLHQMFLSEVG
ncbi:MAG TPA: pyridoxal 5'-phosphate synthase glutaminase subunit PdxT [Acidimicrobiia bacterium]|nr:pyridoxal 5'-phosphate synthase glutaminase subunit PdxT [Acidimicrobiia bacterium]